MSEAFIRAHTKPARAPLVPEFTLQLASEITPIWQATEAWLAARDVAPPYWAFAWPGGQALARHILDHPGAVAGRRVLDFAAGCGLAALAASRAGAAVTAAEIDPLARAAIALNARANGLSVTLAEGDVLQAAAAFDLILAGDVCYEAAMSRRVLAWLEAEAKRGTEVWIADPGRAYLPAGLAPFARYRVPTSRELEDREERETLLFRLTPPPPPEPPRSPPAR
ncbi:MAG: class I SAM-dependent methyltransferase [Acetobacteraceae bacterium]